MFDSFDNNNKNGERLTPQEKEALMKQIIESKIEINSIRELTSLIKEEGHELTKDDFLDTIGGKLKIDLTFDEKEAIKTEKVKVNTEKDKVKIETENIKNKKANYLKLSNSLDGLKGENSEQYSEIINQIEILAIDRKNGLDDESFFKRIDSIIELFKNPAVLEAVSRDFIEQDKINGTSKFEEFKSSIISIDPSFKGRFDGINAKDKVRLASNSSDGISYKNGNIEQITNDNFSIKVDKDGNRSISIPDSNLKIKSGTVNEYRIEEIDRETEKLNKIVEPLNKRLGIISGLKSYIEDIINNFPLEDEDINDYVDDFKESVRQFDYDLFRELNLQSISSKDDILKIKDKLDGIFAKTKEEKEAYEKRSQKIIDNIVLENNKEQERKQNLQKKLLEIFAKYNIDILSQEVFDGVIENINSNPALMAKLNLNKKIDLENGIFGFDRDGNDSKISFEEEELMVRLFNKMITGSFDYPYKLTESGVLFYENIEDFEKNITSTGVDRKKYIGTKLGMNPLQRIMNNINSEEEKKT